jgi:hypothetical protein
MAVFLAMVEPGMATIHEALRPTDEKDQPPIMKQFCGAVGRSDYFAELGRMRQYYVHKARGICKNSARNRVLKWFNKGDNLIPTHANHQQLLTDFPRKSC